MSKVPVICLFDLMLIDLTTSTPCFVFVYITFHQAICLLP